MTARQVRCLHATGPVGLWSSGRDAPQTPSTKGDNGDKRASIGRQDTSRDTPAVKDPWWKKILGRITSIGEGGNQSASLEPKSETSHNGTQPDHSASRLQEPSEAAEKYKQGARTESGHSAHAQQTNSLQHHGQSGGGQGGRTVATTTTEHFPGSQFATDTENPATPWKLESLRLRPNRNSQRINAPRRKYLNHRWRARLQVTANDYYTDSVEFLGKTATTLAGMQCHAVTSTFLSILRRFRSIHQIAILDDDMDVSELCRKYRPTLELLAARLHHPQVADGDLMDGLVSRGVRTNPDVVNYSKTLLHGDVITSTVEACHTRYRKSTFKLLGVADELKDCPSPVVAPIANLVRKRLDAIAEQALLENDSLTLLSFDKHEKDRVKRESRLPYAVFRMKRKGVDIANRWRHYEKRTHNLTKQLAAILPGIPKVYDMYGIRRVIKNPGEYSMHRVHNSFSESSVASTRVERDLADKRLDGRASSRREDVSGVRSRGSPDGVESTDDGQRLMRQMHSQSRSMTSSKHVTMKSEGPGHETGWAQRRSGDQDGVSFNPMPEASSSTSSSASPVTQATISSKQPERSDEFSEQSLLEELFPEVSSSQQPRDVDKGRKQYPKLALPKSRPVIRRDFVGPPHTFKQKVAESLQQQGEQIAVLQLTSCSTELTEVDFRRIIPKGKHLEGWRRDSDFYKVIAGRDPISLERLPFYYLLFKNTEAALAYQKNASRLHKLCALHQPSSSLSAIPPPKGFLEDGEDVAAAVTMYNLLPKNHPMSLNMLMQPYNPALRAVIQRGGYQPIEPSVDSKGKRIWRVLLHIEGWEPTPSDVFSAIAYDAFSQGTLNPLRNESSASLHRLRDVINLRMDSKLVSSNRPRAYGSFDHSGFWQATRGVAVYDDPEIQNMMGPAEDEASQRHMNQYVMNRVYNRWVLDFADGDTARRWSLRWHRKMFRAPSDSGGGDGEWQDNEEARICNTELLW